MLLKATAREGEKETIVMVGEAHLYSVDSKGEATVPPPPSGFRPERRNRAEPKARPQYPVPTDRLKFDTQVRALLTVCSASRNGTEWVNRETMASLMNMSPSTAPLNNAFFVHLGLLEKRGKGDYRPTDTALRFQQKRSFDKDTAPAILAPAFANAWFLKAVRQKLELGETTRDEMIETLASIAGTDNSYATQYGFCLDWLKYVGIITIDNGVIRLTGLAPQSVADEPHLSEPEPQESEPTTQRLPKGAPPVISLAFEMKLTASDLAGLSSEQIADLFDGIAKVAAIKGALSKD